MDFLQNIDLAAITGITAALASGIGLLTSMILRWLSNRAEARRAETAKSEARAASNNKIRETYIRALEQDPELLSLYPNIASLLATFANESEAVGKDGKRGSLPDGSEPPSSAPDRLVEKGSELEVRLTAIEARLPGADVLDRVASANEARLAVQIEHLERDLQKLEGKTLDRGDVYVAALTVVGAVGAIVALVPWLLSLASGAPATQ